MADEYKSLTHSAQNIDNTITEFGAHAADTTIHVTAQNKTDWNNKQSALTTEQLNAVNSGITAAKLAEQDAEIENKIDKARLSISSNSNLNDYMEVGHFKVTSGSIAATITNTPFTTAGYTLDVDYWYQTLSGVVGYIQTAITNAANTLIENKRIYQYSNNTWSWTPWVTIYSISIPT